VRKRRSRSFGRNPEQLLLPLQALTSCYISFVSLKSRAQVSEVRDRRSEVRTQDSEPYSSLEV